MRRNPVSIALMVGCALFASASAEAQFGRGDLIVATRHAGTLRVDLASGEVTQQLTETFIDVATAPGGRIFALTGSATLGAGAELVEIDAATLEVRTIELERDFGAGIALDVDRFGRVVAAVAHDPTTDLVLRIDPDSGAVEELSAGVLVQGASRVLVLRDGAILLSTPFGLVRVDPRTGEARIFTSVRALANTDPAGPGPASAGALAQTRSGAVVVNVEEQPSLAIVDPEIGTVQARLSLVPGLTFPRVDLAIGLRGELILQGIHDLRAFDLGGFRGGAQARASQRMHRLAVMEDDPPARPPRRFRARRVPPFQVLPGLPLPRGRR